MLKSIKQVIEENVHHCFVCGEVLTIDAEISTVGAHFTCYERWAREQDDRVPVERNDRYEWEK